MIFDVNAWVGVWPFRSLRDNTPDTLIARLDRAGVDRAAVSQLEAVFHRNPQPANEKLAHAASKYPDRLLPMATINPIFPKWEQDLAVCHESLGMRGVRLFPQYHDYPADGTAAREAAAACAERNLPVAIHHRIEDVRQRHWMDPGGMVDLDQIAALIAGVPQATFIILNTPPDLRVPHLEMCGYPGRELVLRHVPRGGTLQASSNHRSDDRPGRVYRAGWGGSSRVRVTRACFVYRSRHGETRGSSSR